MSRGRGRGRGMSFNLEAIGFGRGDALPAPLLQPPPKYPTLRKRPLPLIEDDEQECLLSILKDHEHTMKNSQYYLKPDEKKNCTERYSDKYRKTSNSGSNLKWIKEWTFLPSELRTQKRKKKKIIKEIPKVDIVEKLEDLEKKDKNTEEQAETEENADQKKKADNSEIESEIEDFEGEEDEEENDYLTSYFDNGESYLDEEEDNLDDKEGGIY